MNNLDTNNVYTINYNSSSDISKDSDSEKSINTGIKEENTNINEKIRKLEKAIAFLYEIEIERNKKKTCCIIL